MKPTTIPHTKRQAVVTDTGTALERAYIYMPPESWAALKRLSIANHRSTSQVLEALVSTASRGNQVKDTNEQSSPRGR
jgi:hypothetical protein